MIERQVCLIGVKRAPVAICKLLRFALKHFSASFVVIVGGEFVEMMSCDGTNV